MLCLFFTKLSWAGISDYYKNYRIIYNITHVIVHQVDCCVNKRKGKENKMRGHGGIMDSFEFHKLGHECNLIHLETEMKI